MTLKNNIHPGEVLNEEFLKPMNITAYKLAKQIGVQQTRISQIVKGARSISADSAVRFARFFGTTAEFWMNLQREYDIRQVLEQKQEEINSIQKYEAA